MKYEQNDAYIAGLLDSRGGFYIVNRKTRRYLYFKIKVNNEEISKIIFSYFINKLKIKARNWKGMIYITDIDGIQKLTQFMQNSCIRKDYEQILIQHTFDLEENNH